MWSTTRQYVVRSLGKSVDCKLRSTTRAGGIDARLLPGVTRWRNVIGSAGSNGISLLAGNVGIKTGGAKSNSFSVFGDLVGTGELSTAN
jgi:hypothetical protein